MNPNKMFIGIISGCVAFLIASVILIVNLFFPKIENESFALSGNNMLQYNVYYVDNGFFGGGAQPTGVNYIMPYTDYIEVTNGISIKENVDVDCILSVRKVFTINYQNGDDSMVYQTKEILYEKKSVVPGQNGDTVYMIDPWVYVELFREFLQDKQEITEEQDPLGRNASYVPEVSLNFEYILTSGDSREVLTRQIVVPLSNEIYKPVLIGESSFDFATENGGPTRESPSPLVMVLLGVWIAAPLVLIAFAVKRITENRGTPYEFDVIIGKYSQLLVKSISPIDTEGYKDVYVHDFKELVKLSAGLNKSILYFYHQGKEAEFCLFADGLAYCYFAGRMQQIPNNKVRSTIS